MNAFSKVFGQFNLSRLVAFLAFVPLHNIDGAFEALSVHISSSYPALMDVVHYFEKN